MKRTNTCGELREKDLKKEVILAGWVQHRRDHGGVIFIDLRDRYGLTQIVFDPKNNKKPHAIAENLSREDVIQVKGKVRPRKKGMINSKLNTGHIEIIINNIEILNKSETPPIEIEDHIHVNEDVRLKYRYLDLRRNSVQQKFIIRHKAMQATRESLSSQDFLEIETPLLVRSTPEGARDYIVPSRVNPGKVYSLPQSPQIYKQILMVAGFDRYFQLARCLRDEDLRADRQPEFTQIDLEMSFADQEDVFKVIEKTVQNIFEKSLNKKLKIPFPRLSYKESMDRFGTDKPDTRFGLEHIDITDICAKSEFKIFKDIAKNYGLIKCFCIPEGTIKISRKKLEELNKFVRIYKAQGLTWLKIDKNIEGPLAKFFNKDQINEIIKRTKAKKTDLILVLGDYNPKIAHNALAETRNKIAKDLNLYDSEKFNFVWITDFPLFEWDDEIDSWSPAHHMFTMPKEEHLKYLNEDPGKIIAECYDLVLNGIELGSGSVREYRPEIQKKIMKVIRIDEKEAYEKFGFMLEAFKYGAPPHAGFAIGFDRLIALMCKTNDIREVIAFPKSKSAECPMDGCPSEISNDELKEIHLQWNIIKKDKK